MPVIKDSLKKQNREEKRSPFFAGADFHYPFHLLARGMV